MGVGSYSYVYLMHTDVALVTEHHIISLFAVRGATHITDNVLVVFDPQTLHSHDGVVHVVMALPLQGLNGSLHCQLVYGRLPWKAAHIVRTLSVLISSDFAEAGVCSCDGAIGYHLNIFAHYPCGLALC